MCLCFSYTLQTGGATYRAHILHSAFTDLWTGKDDLCVSECWNLGGCCHWWLVDSRKGILLKSLSPHLTCLQNHILNLWVIKFPTWTFQEEHYCLTKISDNSRVALFWKLGNFSFRVSSICKHYWLRLYLRCWWRAHALVLDMKMFTFLFLYITSKIVF